MLILVTKSFQDFLCDVPRDFGALLEVSEERGKEIINAGYARAVEITPGMPETSEDDKKDEAKDGVKGKGKTKKA